MLLGTFGASLLGNMSSGKDVIKAGNRVIRPGKGTNRARQSFEQL